MINLRLGTKEILPCVEVFITTAKYPFQYKLKTNVWVPEHKEWEHRTEEDRTIFGLWFAAKKAKEVLRRVWADEPNGLIQACKCDNEFQDKAHGNGRRLHNKTKRGFRCTSCGKEKK